MRVLKGKAIQKSNRIIFCFLITLSFITAPPINPDNGVTFTQDTEKKPDWENLGVLSKNREAPHCTLVPYNNLEGVIQGQPEESP